MQALVKRIGGGVWLAHRIVTAVAFFAVANLCMGLASVRMDSNWIWISSRWLPPTAQALLLAGFAFGVLCHGRLPRPVRVAARLIVGIVAVICLTDAVAYYRLVWVGRIATALPVPLSLLLTAALAVWLCRPPVAEASRRWRARLLRLAGVGAAAMACVFVQLTAFGATDYRRPADSIVVFGAGVRPDGSPSLALYQRTETACRLYHSGLAERLVFSGGRNPSVPLSEPEAMRRLALRLGVPPDAIILDEDGNTTAATVENVAGLADERGWERVLMVSHDYHLSRIKLLTHRADLRSFTVPAKESRPLRKKPFYVLREIAAWLHHCLLRA